MNHFMNFDRYTAVAMSFYIFLTIISTIVAILLREARNENSNWSAPVWLANVIICVMSFFVGGFILTVWEISTSLHMTPGPWVLIPVAILGWITTLFFHAITKKIAPKMIKSIALFLFP